MGHPMPSPVGHSLAATAVGWALNRPAPRWRPMLIQTAILALVGTAPDLDILWGRHSRETHSIGAALVCAAIAAWQRWPVGARSRPMIFASVAAAWFSHPILDAFALSDRPWPGVWMWWPFNATPVHSVHAFFEPIWRDFDRAGIWAQNFTAAGHETLLIAPIVLIVWLIRRKSERALG